MQSFFPSPIRSIVNGALLRTSPVYVQYYLTARCNLRCEQCNIIYANADQTELDAANSLKVLDTLAELGTSVVLFTGGEPFLRKDLPELVSHAIELGMHPRIQTNGLATREMLERVAESGANDISISLDTLEPEKQDEINGGFSNSFLAAMRSISLVNEIFPSNSFAALGCVFAPKNFMTTTQIVDFATEIGWWVSLVPAHTTVSHKPRGFSTFDGTLKFSTDELVSAKVTLSEIKKKKKSGANVYDSYQYLDDIYRFIAGEPVTWRDRNGGSCDSPSSYFAITPNGDMAVCCDYRLPERKNLTSPSFTREFKNKEMHKLALPIINSCSGCMYGSFPEISNSLRFAHAAVNRLGLFFGESQSQLSKFSEAELISLAQRIVSESK